MRRWLTTRRPYDPAILAMALLLWVLAVVWILSLVLSTRTELPDRPRRTRPPVSAPIMDHSPERYLASLRIAG